MPRRFFRRVSSGYLRKEHPWYLKPFDIAQAHPTFFSVSRRSIAGAVWAGLFVAMLPLPGQTVIGILVALLLRVNLPVAAITTWATNPLTMVPVFYWEYILGTLILDVPPQGFSIELSWEWATNGFLKIWKPLMLGSFITAAVASSIGYLVISITWRLLVSARYRSRHLKDRS